MRPVSDEKLPAPVPRDNLVALRDRRELVIARLTEGFAKDLYDVDEFDRRIDLAHRARSLAELDDLVVDLEGVDAWWIGPDGDIHGSPSGPLAHASDREPSRADRHGVIGTTAPSV